MKPRTRERLNSLTTVAVGLLVVLAILFIGGLADCNTVVAC